MHLLCWLAVRHKEEGKDCDYISRAITALFTYPGRDISLNCMLDVCMHSHLILSNNAADLTNEFPNALPPFLTPRQCIETRLEKRLKMLAQSTRNGALCPISLLPSPQLLRNCGSRTHLSPHKLVMHFGYSPDFMNHVSPCANFSTQCPPRLSRAPCLQSLEQTAAPARTRSSHSCIGRGAQPYRVPSLLQNHAGTVSCAHLVS